MREINGRPTRGSTATMVDRLPASVAFRMEHGCDCRNCIDSCRVSSYFVGNTKPLRPQDE